jgi:ribosomal protein L4
VAKSVVVVKNRGSKRARVVRVSAQAVTQSGAVVVSFLAHVAMKTTPRKSAPLVHILDVKATGKTADFAKWLETNKLTRKVLIVVDEKTPALLRATSNINNVMVVRATYLNVYNILNADHIVFNPAAIKLVQEWLQKKEA